MNADERGFKATQPRVTRSLFTVVREMDDYVDARLRLSVVFAYLLALVAILWAWRLFAGGMGPLVAVVLLCVFAANHVRILGRLRRDWRFRHIVIHDRCEASPPPGQFAADEITRVVVEKAADHPASQLLVHIRGQQEPLLLFHAQSPAKPCVLAERLANRWQVECTIPAPSIDPPQMRRVQRVAGYFMLLIGAAIGVRGGWAIAREKAMLHWPSTTATIVQWDAGINGSDDDEPFHYACPYAVYQYSVAGQLYESARLSPDPLNYQAETTFEKDLGRVTKGSIAPCWYNPAHPAEAYLVNRGITGGTVGLMIISAVFVTLSIGTLRQSKPSRVTSSG